MVPKVGLVFLEASEEEEDELIHVLVRTSVYHSWNTVFVGSPGLYRRRAHKTNVERAHSSAETLVYAGACPQSHMNDERCRRALRHHTVH